MNIALLALAFVTGLVVAGTIAYRLLKREESRWQSNPFLTPKAEIVKRLQEAVMHQVYRWDEAGYRTDANSPRQLHEALELLADLPNARGVWIQERDVVILPGGERVPIRMLMQEIRTLLVDSYRALDTAASIVLDYHDMLPNSRLDDPGQLLHGRKQAFERECLALAELLGVDSDANHLAEYGLMRLWEMHLEVKRRREYPRGAVAFTDVPGTPWTRHRLVAAGT